MKTLTKSVAGFAALVLASLPVAALSTAAHAQSSSEIVRVSDLNLNTATDKATFAKRVDHAARHFCSAEKNLDMKEACLTSVRAEANEKAAANVQFASRN